MEPLISLFWTSGDVCPGSESQSGFPYFISDSLADLSVACLAAEPFPMHILSNVQALVGLESRIEHPATSQHVTRHMILAELCRVG